MVEFLELGGEDALAGEEQGVGHFAEYEAQGEGGGREERGTADSGGQDFCEIDIGYWLR